MRISDWSSDVCSSDLVLRQAVEGLALRFDVAGDDRSLRHVDRGLTHAIGIDFIRRGNRLVLQRLCRVDQHGGFATNRRGFSGHAFFERATGKAADQRAEIRSEEHTSELQSLMRISYAVFCLKKKNN